VVLYGVENGSFFINKHPVSKRVFEEKLSSLRRNICVPVFCDEIPSLDIPDCIKIRFLKREDWAGAGYFDYFSFIKDENKFEKKFLHMSGKWNKGYSSIPNHPPSWFAGLVGVVSYPLETPDEQILADKNSYHPSIRGQNKNYFNNGVCEQFEIDDVDITSFYSLILMYKPMPYGRGQKMSYKHFIKLMTLIKLGKMGKFEGVAKVKLYNVKHKENCLYWTGRLWDKQITNYQLEEASVIENLELNLYELAFILENYNVGKIEYVKGHMYPVKLLDNETYNDIVNAVLSDKSSIEKILFNSLSGTYALKTGKRIHNAIGTSIVAFGKYFMMTGMKKFGLENIIQWNTDGFVLKNINKKIVDKYNSNVEELTGSNLGKLKLKHYKWFASKGPNKYAYVDAKYKFVIKHSGLTANEKSKYENMDEYKKFLNSCLNTDVYFDFKDMPFVVAPRCSMEDLDK